MTKQFIKPEQPFSQDLSADELDFTTTTPNNRPVHLDMVHIKFSGAVSETVTVTLDSAQGSSYDVVLDEIVLVSETDYVYRPQGRCIIGIGDEIRVQCTNVGGSGTAKGAVKTSEV